MLHATDREEAIEVIDVQHGMLSHKPLHGLVVVNRVSGTYELVRPSNIMNQLSIVLGTREP